MSTAELVSSEPPPPFVEVAGPPWLPGPLEPTAPPPGPFTSAFHRPFQCPSTAFTVLIDVLFTAVLLHHQARSTCTCLAHQVNLRQLPCASTTFLRLRQCLSLAGRGPPPPPPPPAAPVARDVALNKPVLADSSLSGYTAALALDGDHETDSSRWVSTASKRHRLSFALPPRCHSTNGFNAFACGAAATEQHWLAVDLQQYYTLSRVRVYAGWNAGTQFGMCRLGTVLWLPVRCPFTVLSLCFHCAFHRLSLSFGWRSLFTVPFHCPFPVLWLPFHCSFAVLALSLHCPFAAISLPFHYCSHSVSCYTGEPGTDLAAATRSASR